MAQLNKSVCAVHVYSRFMNLYINIKLHVIFRNYVDLVNLTDVTVDDDIDASEESYDLPPAVASSTPGEVLGIAAPM